MEWSTLRTDRDVERFKKWAVKDPVLSARLKRVQMTHAYTRSGASRTTHADAVTMPSKAELLAVYRELIREGVVAEEAHVLLALRKIRTKSNSGVAVVSLLTKPFACPGRCTYCPTDVSMPKSYLAEEPAAARALANDFDAYQQVTSRLTALKANGHPVDKVEMIVIGGTWSFYHPVYQEEFLIGAYRALNDFGTETDSRTETYTDRLAYVMQLQKRNESARVRQVGLSIETRPDYITHFEIARLRKLGVTKVEIGVQHLDDDILRQTKRDMRIERVKRATALLRDAGFKMVYHMMPNLPGSTPARDVSMFYELFDGPDFQPDMLKIYPCMVLKNSELYDTWKQGGFVPYSDEVLLPLLADIEHAVPPYVRILRVIRDIPATYIEAGSRISNLREEVDKLLLARHTPCVCIRCRELREGVASPSDYQLTKREYRAGEGDEYFLSFEDPNTMMLVSFLRLRIPDHPVHETLPVLEGAALVRELHTYGKHTAISGSTLGGQHLGYGRRLLMHAEAIAKARGCVKVAIIAGVGVRAYYEKQGYHEEGTYMVKYLDNEMHHDSHQAL